MPIWSMIHQFIFEERDREKRETFREIRMCGVGILCARALQTTNRWTIANASIHSPYAFFCVCVLPRWVAHAYDDGFTSLLSIWLLCLDYYFVVSQMHLWAQQHHRCGGNGWMEQRREDDRKIDKRRNVIHSWKGRARTSIRKSFCLVFRSCHSNGTAQKAKWLHYVRNNYCIQLPEIFLFVQRLAELFIQKRRKKIEWKIRRRLAFDRKLNTIQYSNNGEKNSDIWSSRIESEWLRRELNAQFELLCRRHIQFGCAWTWTWNNET